MDYRAEILENTKIAESITVCKRKGVACGLLQGEATKWFFNGPIGRDPTLCSNEVGNCGCIHAEFRAVENAIRWRQLRGEKASLLVNFSPCTSCANLIAVSGCIERVYYITLTEHDKRGLRHLEKAGVEVIQLRADFKGPYGQGYATG